MLPTHILRENDEREDAEHEWTTTLHVDVEQLACGKSLNAHYKKRFDELLTEIGCQVGCALIR